MENETIIKVEQFCTHYQVEVSFIDALQEYGLVELISREKERFISEEHIRGIEKLIRLHYDLEVNMPGIDVITHLLKRVENLQTELNGIRNRLQD
ncbi:MAG: chaperone modulator CbpM [Bacteroidia bacterium]|nr:chaperone modulator CbpM [Bacteroidia bacterium]